MDEIRSAMSPITELLLGKQAKEMYDKMRENGANLPDYRNIHSAHKSIFDTQILNEDEKEDDPNDEPRA
eukprot:TRINITY_DN15661_c0_g1_i1.p2 TRINITY_DN15661_c0_g1~~TRINITY_DN15661_c0_g1_i1.p2  ORF type:complete len:69 (+),score=13.83 TRINITY_DN15661_c0_g1_i1:109-315(+)